ncbi:MAG: nitroreductase family protein [Ilumatobacteraceae bacterium]
MDALETLMTTRSMRRYTDEPVSDADVETCLAAAQQAPSGGNVQPQQYVVVTDPDVKARLANWYLKAYDRYEKVLPIGDGRDEAETKQRLKSRQMARNLAEHLAEIPVLVVFLQPLIPWGGHDDEGPIDIGRLDASVYPAVQNFCLAARALGLGTAYTTVIRVYGDEALAELGVPGGRYEIAALIPVGHPVGNFGVAPRKPFRAVTHWNRWGDKRR